MSKSHAAVIWSAHIPESENTTRHQRASVLSAEYDCDFYLFGDRDRNSNADFENVTYIEKTGIISGLKFMLTMIYLVGIAGRNEYELVHTSYHPLTCLVGFVCSFSTEKWIQDIWDHPLRTVPKPSKSMSTREVVTFLTKYAAHNAAIRTMPFADRIILALHPSITKELGVKNDEIVPVPNGTDFALYQGVEAESREDFTVIYAGEVTPDRANLMLEAASVAAAEIPNLSVMFVGEIKDERLLRRKISQYGMTETVEITGHVPHSTALSAIRGADVGLCLLPRSVETEYVYPIKLFEYMALGAVPIASSLRGISSVVEDWENGHLVPPDDGYEAGERIVETYKSDTDELVENASETVKSYDWDHLNNQFKTAIKNE